MIRYKYTHFILVFFFGALLFSCEEPFTPDIDTKEYENMLVVEGLITNEEGPFRVHLTTSVPLDTNKTSLPVEGALVEIFDDNNQTYDLYYKGDGWYETKEKDLQAEEGVGYTLSILTANGVQYESTRVEMITGPEIEKIHYAEQLQTNFATIPPKGEKWLDILVDTKGMSGETSFVKWEFEETWEVNIPEDVQAIDSQGNYHDEVVKPNTEIRHCWITARSNTIHIASTEKQETNDVVDYTLKSIGPGNNLLDIKYSILVKQYSMNKEMYNFWKKLKDTNENLGSMFDKTPSAIYGNVYCCDTENKTLGYFMVSDVKQKRIFIDKSDHGISTNTGYEYCIYSYLRLEGYELFGQTVESNTNLYHDVPNCISCLTEGTNVKPSFWK